MKVTVYRNETAIGTGILEHLDPPMGVAFGPFSPLDQYDRERDANTIEGNYVGDRGQALSAYAGQHGRLQTAAIAIEDWADPEFGKHLTLWFQDSGNFAALFSTHDDYLSYYQQ